MSDILSQKLEEIKKSRSGKEGDWIKVGMSTCGIAAGAQDVFDLFVAEQKKHNLNITIERCGCAGQCYAEPLVEVKVSGMPQVIYGRVDKGKAQAIIEQHVMRHKLIDDHIYSVKVTA